MLGGAAAGVLGLFALTLLAACGGGETSGAATETPEATRLPTELRESGVAPVFWRTADEFESLRAGEPYKIVLRITSGFDDETLRIVADPDGEGSTEEFEAVLVEPASDEGPGSFYTFLLELPEPGGWQVTAMAGDDAAPITVDVKPAGSSTRY